MTMSTERLEALRKANEKSILSHKVVLELFAEIDALRAKLGPKDEPVTCLFTDGDDRLRTAPAPEGK